MNNKKAKYICIEGVDGVGKTTQIKKIEKYLKKQGFKVLITRDVGSPHLSMTKKIRKLMLDEKFSPELTKLSRELLSYSMRSIHLEKLIDPSLEKYDYIIQDRGFLSAWSYGEACGVDLSILLKISKEVIENSRNFKDLSNIYDHLILLKGNPKIGLIRAKEAKTEFKNGDAMETLGDSFLEKVSKNMDHNLIYFNSATRNEIDVNGKSPDQVFDEILEIIK